MSYEIQIESLVTVKKDGDLIAVVDNNLKKRSQVISSCSEMGQDGVKELLDKINIDK